MTSPLTTPRSIAALPDQLISQIAAGEVVERPSAVVKELLENALDAGATQITIRLEQGGIKRIAITDNGRGIPADEIPLALARHATSKITSLAELENVATLGFRGEALASIASIAQLTLTTRTATAAHAWEMSGSQPAPVPSSGATGTTIDVQDLYYNTPARRKFLKSDQTEYGHCAEVVRRIALSRPDVAFSLTHNGKTVDHWTLTDMDRRSAHILGSDRTATPAWVCRLADRFARARRCAIFLRQRPLCARQVAYACGALGLSGCAARRSLSVLRTGARPRSGTGRRQCPSIEN
jgi:DNA mismatch repair protein MutL